MDMTKLRLANSQFAFMDNGIKDIPFRHSIIGRWDFMNQMQRIFPERIYLIQVLYEGYLDDIKSRLDQSQRNWK